MKKLLFGTLMVGALATSSMAILQLDIPASLFDGTCGMVDAATFTTMDGVTRPATLIPACADGFPLAFHAIFNYDAAPPALPIVTAFTVTSGSCTVAWNPPMYSVLYSQGPTFPVNWAGGGFLGCHGIPCEYSCSAPQLVDFGVVTFNDPGNDYASVTFQVCNTTTGTDCDPMVINLAESCDQITVSPGTVTLAQGACADIVVELVSRVEGPFDCVIETTCGPVHVTGTVVVDANEAPAVFALGEAYPNPFNPTTTISYSVPETQEATLAVFNTNGQLVQTLVSGMVERGEHKVVFDASSLSSGVYVYTLQTANETSMKKMVLVK